MDFKSQQTIFDDIKWYDSILAGYDRCGSYEFCGVCNKDEKEPCARAAYRYQQPEAAAMEEELCATADEVVSPKRLTPIVIVRLKKK